MAPGRLSPCTMCPSVWMAEQCAGGQAGTSSICIYSPAPSAGAGAVSDTLPPKTAPEPCEPPCGGVRGGTSTPMQCFHVHSRCRKNSWQLLRAPSQAGCARAHLGCAGIRLLAHLWTRARERVLAAAPQWAQGRRPHIAVVYHIVSHRVAAAQCQKRSSTRSSSWSLSDNAGALRARTDRCLSRQ